jgi:hypothetical protein
MALGAAAPRCSRAPARSAGAGRAPAGRAGACRRQAGRPSRPRAGRAHQAAAVQVLQRCSRAPARSAGAGGAPTEAGRRMHAQARRLRPNPSITLTLAHRAPGGGHAGTAAPAPRPARPPAAAARAAAATRARGTGRAAAPARRCLRSGGRGVSAQPAGAPAYARRSDLPAMRVGAGGARPTLQRRLHHAARYERRAQACRTRPRTMHRDVRTHALIAAHDPTPPDRCSRSSTIDPVINPTVAASDAPPAASRQAPQPRRRAPASQNSMTTMPRYDANSTSGAASLAAVEPERRAARMPRAPGRARPGSERQPLEDVLLGVSGMDPVDFQSRGAWSWPPAPAAGFPGPAAGSQSPASPGATLSPVKNGDAMVPASCAGFSQTTDVSKAPWPGPPPALGPPAPSCCGACLSPDSQSLPAPCGRAQAACLIDSLALRRCVLTQRGPAILQTCHKHPDARRTRKVGRAQSAKGALQLILTLF